VEDSEFEEIYKMQDLYNEYQLPNKNLMGGKKRYY
jgi:hypothetical protein